MGVIATAAKFLIAAGVAGDELVKALEEIENAGIPALDPVRERRRAYDREYRKREREVKDRPTSDDSDDSANEQKKDPPDPLKENNIKPSPKGEVKRAAEPLAPASPDAPLLVIFPSKADLDWALDEWNELADDVGLSKALKLTAQRRRSLISRLRELGSREAWTDALMCVARSPFCCGENDRGWRANLDFVLQPSSMTKLLEGFYDGKVQGQRQQR